VPFVSAANALFVTIWHFGDKLNIHWKIVRRIATCAVAALCKFALLYLGVVRVAIPLILDVPEPVANALTIAFSVNQLFTASIGGAVAIMALPVLEKAISLRKKD
jgi:hypothetical protein